MSRAEVSVPLDLLESLVDDEDCRFDHHGGCQEHGYLSLEQGEECPQFELKRRIAEALDLAPRCEFCGEPAPDDQFHPYWHDDGSPMASCDDCLAAPSPETEGGPK